MVNRRVADDVIDIFYKLYLKQYPLASVKLVDDFGQPGDDGNSMRANNTSAFCYRQVTGSNHLSWHSFGAAIDINPLQNPYVNKGRVSPEEAREYLDRKDKRPHMIDHSDYCYKVFKAHGWKWGGDWAGDKDYQHFYKELKGVTR
ncbi:MAG: M15 family metallopeptidase [Clostridia bacterium]|nr:M15 family metallopeptidase [Clostridia bacterium]